MHQPNITNPMIINKAGTTLRVNRVATILNCGLSSNGKHSTSWSYIVFLYRYYQSKDFPTTKEPAIQAIP